MVERTRIEPAQFVARIRQGAARVYRIGNEFAVVSDLNARGCERIEFRSETFLAASAALLVGYLLDEMRSARRGVSPGESTGSLERSLDALPREGLQTTSSILWRALARADLIESIIDCAAGQSDYSTRRVAIHTPHGRDNAPYVVAVDGRNLRVLGSAALRGSLLGLLSRADAEDSGAHRSRFERRGKPERLRWLEFRRTTPVLAQAFVERFGPPFFGERRRGRDAATTGTDKHE